MSDYNPRFLNVSDFPVNNCIKAFVYVRQSFLNNANLGSYDLVFCEI